jgi:hypothetical protein
MKLLFFEYLKLHTMSLIPLDRDHMRLLHSRKLDQLFKHRIEQIASVIYKNAISTAEQGELKYFYCLPSIQPTKYARLTQDTSIISEYTSDAIFVRKHMDHILEKVRFLFDGCSVEHRTIVLVKSRDGKHIDLSDVDDKLKHMFSRIEPKEYIVVDWS